MNTAQDIHDNFLASKEGFVEAVIMDYKNGKAGLHTGACVVLFHAVKTGDCRPITKFFKSLDEMESKKFKPWVGALTTIKEGLETFRVMKFKTDEGFIISKGTHNLRGGLWMNGLGDLLDSKDTPHFMDFKPEKTKVDPNLEKLLKLVRSTVKNVENKADEVGAVLPKDIRNRMDDLLKLVEVHLPQAKGVANQVKPQLTPPTTEEDSE